MDLIKSEKELDRKLRNRIKDLLKVAKTKKEIRNNNEDKLEKELGFQTSMKKFHKPVTEKMEKSNKNVVKSIQNAIENISQLEPPRVSEIEYKLFELGNLFEEKSSTGTHIKLRA